MIAHRTLTRWLVPACLLLALLLVYAPTVQTIPNGSDHYFMIDVGETQVVLNVWGTLHYTGYPLYVMTGSALTALFRLLGANPATAASLVSLVWGMTGALLVYLLARHLTRRDGLAALVTLVYGLTRTFWIHAAIAEIYSFGFVLLMLLLMLALWQRPVRGRIYWLAFVGGLAVAHHRSLAFVAPALIVAVWPELTRDPRSLPRRLLGYLALGLLGFLPYVYLPLRAWAGASWVYGYPGTWAGFWEQFNATEAARFIGVPETASGLAANIEIVNRVLLTDLTLPGLLVGLVGLVVGIIRPRTRRPALVIALAGGVSYVFHALLYTDVLSALILQVTVALAFGWLFAGDALLERARASRGAAMAALTVAALALSAALITQNGPFIRSLVEDPTGLETMALVEQTPPGSTLMIAWGHRHFAAGYARDVLGRLPDVRLVDHNADFAALAAETPLITPDFTFYNYPVAWWQERLGAPVTLRAVAPSLVEIATTPDLRDDFAALDAHEAAVQCDADRLLLSVTWGAPETPATDLSVFVHLLDDQGAMLAQSDQSAPVYGWRPLTTWLPGEAVRDVYALPNVTGAAQIRFGLYHQREDGSFENVLQRELPVECRTAGE